MNFTKNNSKNFPLEMVYKHRFGGFCILGIVYKILFLDRYCGREKLFSEAFETIRYLQEENKLWMIDKKGF